jgi:glyoxylase-like metal-dependent hydrolase (beta-lactamase superfamily II)
VRLFPPTAPAAPLAAGDERCIEYAVQRTFEPFRVDVVLRDREELTVEGLRARCLAAPGRTDGLLVSELVLDGERLWFVGDLLQTLHMHQWVELPWTGAPDFDRAKYIQSVARLLKLPPCDHLMPGHGPVGIGCGRRLLEMAYTEALLKWR